MDSFEEELCADADEFSRSTDATGVSRVTATFDLTKLKEKDDPENDV